MGILGKLLQCLFSDWRFSDNIVYHTRPEIGKLQPIGHTWSAGYIQPTAYLCMTPQLSMVFTIFNVKKYFVTHENCMKFKI